MEFQHLTKDDIVGLDELVDQDEITDYDLPLGLTIGADSMGPFRNSKTDKLWNLVKTALKDFSTTMETYGLSLIVTTNGPNKEGIEILQGLDPKKTVSASAITEGAGNVIYLEDKEPKKERLADENEIAELKSLEGKVASVDDLLKILMNDREETEGIPEIRTDYDTMMVLTLPAKYSNFLKKLEKSDMNEEELKKEFISDIGENNYVQRVIEYARDNFGHARLNQGLINVIADPQTNLSNRRIYVGVEHLQDGRKRTKSNGAVAGSRAMRSLNGKSPIYARDYSAYIADLITVRTSEGLTLGETERSMVQDDPDAARLALNVTLKNGGPTLEYVNGVRVLNVRTGVMALEALTHLYGKLYPNVKPILERAI